MDTPERVVLWDPSSGEWIRLRGGGLGSPVISRSQSSAPLELRPREESEDRSGREVYFSLKNLIKIKSTLVLRLSIIKILVS